MLRDYLKVEKEDQLVEQQSRHDNSQHYSSVTEWVILSKDGQRKGRVSLFDRFTTRRSWATVSALRSSIMRVKWWWINSLTRCKSFSSRPDGRILIRKINTCIKYIDASPSCYFLSAYR